MKYKLSKFREGSIVYDIDSQDWLQISDPESLVFINANKSRFRGFPLSDDSISAFFSDLKIVGNNGRIYEYRYSVNEDDELFYPAFYFKYNKDIFDPYKVFFCVFNGDSISVKYVHE
ncbi:MAG: hypothetical protein NTY95_18490, partial [Bacteroidia bacterium]|nr:hypothetical protein [Bacteroidia bacterium]